MSLPPVLERMIESETIPHALLFTGDARIAMADAFTQTLLGCDDKWRADLHRYHPEKKSGLHPISHIRSLINEVAFFPYAGKWKVFIIYDAERMLPPSSNALLKTLEEPTPNTLLLLLSGHPNNLLPTIRSRCQTYFFQGVHKERSLSEQLLLQLLCSPQREDYLYLRKEIEKICQEKEKGEVTIEMHEEGMLLFATILEWARDLLALLCGSNHLIHKDFCSHYEQYLASNPLPDLFHMEQKVKDARISLERSLKLSTCLEALLLKHESLV